MSVADRPACHATLRRSFLRELGFTPAEFDVVAWITGWCVVAAALGSFP